MTLAVFASVVMLLLQEQLLIPEVDGEGDGRDAKAREAALEPVPTREYPCVSPALTVLFTSPRYPPIHRQCFLLEQKEGKRGRGGRERERDTHTHREREREREREGGGRRRKSKG